MKRRPRPKSKDKGERPADLTFWFRDGFCGGYDARVEANTELSIGRTNSRRALGFIINRNGRMLEGSDFVLDRDQCEELAAYLQQFAPLKKPQGRKPRQISLVALAKHARASAKKR
jgi:hypothetical protein